MLQIPRDQILAISCDQMREVDRAMIEDVHIELPQMMENAGRNLADLAAARFGPRSVTVLAGPGGNGGGGLVAARHLANRGVDVAVTLSHPVQEMTPVPAHQLDIVTQMGIQTGAPEPADLIIDALIGYSLQRDPRGRSAELIEWANDQVAPILALDTPSGLDVTTGVPRVPCIRAAATMTLALRKLGSTRQPESVDCIWLTSPCHSWSTSGWDSRLAACSGTHPYWKSACDRMSFCLDLAEPLDVT
jgi:NAD(P)H-hydrate epimerase